MTDDAPYLRALTAFAAREPARLTVPGHKGGAAAAAHQLGAAAHALDVPTLIPGVDLAAGPEPAPFAEAERLAAHAWGAARTWFLTGGASQGNHAACLAIAQQGGGRVVVQRSAHGSTIDGLVLAGLEPVFVAAEADPALGIAHCVTPAALERVLSATPDAAAAFVVSPTYFGAVADVRGLARVAHRHGVPLVVDEAWGTHLAFSDRLPEHALAAGADLVIGSPHKHLGSLTGAALLHLGDGARIDTLAVERALRLVSSTSPSSLLRASLDAARARAVRDGAQLLNDMADELAALRERIGWISGIRAVGTALDQIDGVAGLDPLRLTIDVRESGAQGPQWGRLLRTLADVELELCDTHVLVAVFGFGEDVRATGERLLPALMRASRRLGRRSEGAPALPSVAPPALRMTPRAAFLAGSEPVVLEDALGRIAAEPLIPYPPGIPLVLPGEELNRGVLARAQQTVRAGIAMRGPADPSLGTIRVVCEDDADRLASDGSLAGAGA